MYHKSTYDTYLRMTHVSKWSLSSEAGNKVKSVFVNELLKVKSEKEMETLTEVLLTETERLMIPKRIFAFVLIDQGLTDVEIAKRLHFTRATVERLRRTYKHLDELEKPVRKLVRQFSTSEKIKDLLEKFLGGYLLPAMGGRIPKKFPF